MNELSCLLITCNKPAYLLRSVAFYSTTSLYIDIYDGSPESNEALIAPFLSDHIHYHHYPNTGSIHRATTALANVKTDFVKILADDDFSLEAGLNSCVDFLCNNPDYIACFGTIFSYTESDSSIQYYLSEQHNFNFKIEQNNSTQRVLQFWSKCSYGLQHAVFRTDLYKKCLEFTYYGLSGSGDYDFNLRERVLLTSIAALGKCQFLHTPFMLRESRKNTEGAKSLDLSQIKLDDQNQGIYYLFLTKLELIAAFCDEQTPYIFAKTVDELITNWESNIRRSIWRHPILFSSQWQIFSKLPLLRFEPIQFIEYGFYTPAFFETLYGIDFRVRSYALCSSNPLHFSFTWQPDTKSIENTHNSLITLLSNHPFHLKALYSLQEQLRRFPDETIKQLCNDWIGRIHQSGLDRILHAQLESI